MSKGASRAKHEGRLAVVESLHRQGCSPMTIAKYLLTDQECLDNGFDNGVSQNQDLTFPQKQHHLLPVIHSAVKLITERNTLPVDGETRERALQEYIYREDGIFESACRYAREAFDYRDKISALKLAQTSAQNKARALGVVLTPDPELMSALGQAGVPGVTINNLGQLVLLNGQRGINQGSSGAIGGESGNCTQFPQLNAAADSSAG
jgi:hypothetical protein